LKIAILNTNEEILIFDYAKHGYDSMFCDTFDEENLRDRTLQKLKILLSKIFLRLGHGIGCKEEKDDYDFDEN
jgi:hypothetical protein